MTTRRLRVYASLLAVTLWSVWLVDISGPGVIDRLGKIKGTDFLQFYVAGSFVRESRTDLLYDPGAHYARAQAITGTPDETRYLPVQSPQTALAFAALAGFPYTSALTIWLAVVFILYAAACWLTWSTCTALGEYRAEAVVGCVAFPALYSTVLHGQISCAAVFWVAVALVTLRRGHGLSAGVALGCLVFKPHWVLAAGAVFVVAREWRVVIGIVAAAAAQVAAAYLVLGSGAMVAYASMLRSLPRFAVLLEPRPSNTLKGFFQVFVPADTVALVLYSAATVMTVLVTGAVWRTSARFEIRFSAVLLAMVLISPHAFEYDLILLAPAYLLLANWRAAAEYDRRMRTMSWASAALFVAPLLTGLPAVLRLQFSVTAMVVMLVNLWLTARPRLAPAGRPARPGVSVNLADPIATQP